MSNSPRNSVNLNNNNNDGSWRSRLTRMFGSSAANEFTETNNNTSYSSSSLYSGTYPPTTSSTTTTTNTSTLNSNTTLSSSSSNLLSNNSNNTNKPPIEIKHNFLTLQDEYNHSIEFYKKLEKRLNDLQKANQHVIEKEQSLAQLFLEYSGKFKSNKEMSETLKKFGSNVKASSTLLSQTMTVLDEVKNTSTELSKEFKHYKNCKNKFESSKSDYENFKLELPKVTEKEGISTKPNENGEYDPLYIEKVSKVEEEFNSISKNLNDNYFQFFGEVHYQMKLRDDRFWHQMKSFIYAYYCYFSTAMALYQPLEPICKKSGNNSNGNNGNNGNGGNGSGQDVLISSDIARRDFLQKLQIQIQFQQQFEQQNNNHNNSVNANKINHRASINCGNASFDKEDLKNVVQIPKHYFPFIFQVPLPKIFGTPLDKIMEIDIEYGIKVLPNCIEQLFRYLRMYGLKSEGLFRINSDEVYLKSLITMIDNRCDIPYLTKSYFIPSIAGVLKMFIRELPEPLMTFQAFQDIIQNVEFMNLPKTILQIQKLKEFIAKNVPIHYQVVLYELTKLLNEVTEHVSENKMNATNLALIFSMNLFKPRIDNAMLIAQYVKQMSYVTCLLIEYYKALFDGELIKICDERMNKELKNNNNNTTNIATTTTISPRGGEENRQSRSNSANNNTTTNINSSRSNVSTNSGYDGGNLVSSNNTASTSSSTNSPRNEEDYKEEEVLFAEDEHYLDNNNNEEDEEEDIESSNSSPPSIALSTDISLKKEKNNNQQKQHSRNGSNVSHTSSDNNDLISSPSHDRPVVSSPIVYNEFNELPQLNISTNLMTPKVIKTTETDETIKLKLRLPSGSVINRVKQVKKSNVVVNRQSIAVSKLAIDKLN
ncbi:hypothetical protein ABK040_014592 [Willaertia magna]